MNYLQNITSTVSHIFNSIFNNTYEDPTLFHSDKCFEIFDAQGTKICSNAYSDMLHTFVRPMKEYSICGDPNDADIRTFRNDGHNTILYKKNCIAVVWKHNDWHKNYNLENCLQEFFQYEFSLMRPLKISFVVCYKSHLVGTEIIGELMQLEQDMS